MRVRYFEQTDTLLIEFRDALEHPSKRIDTPKFSFERVSG